VTFKKPARASVQIFSDRTTKPVWFLKLWFSVAAGNSELGNQDRGQIVRNPLPRAKTLLANQSKNLMKEIKRLVLEASPCSASLP
jgi:hypothetical protein